MSVKIYKIEVTYFIQGEITQRIKIGKTATAISERIRILQTGSPDKLQFLGLCYGYRRTEGYLHNLFSKYRLHGEWFSPEPEILEYINNNCITDETAFCHIYEEIIKDNLTFDDVLNIGTAKLKEMSDEHTKQIMQNLWKNVKIPKFD